MTAERKGSAGKESTREKDCERKSVARRKSKSERRRRRRRRRGSEKQGEKGERLRSLSWTSSARQRIMRRRDGKSFHEPPRRRRRRRQRLRQRLRRRWFSMCSLQWNFLSYSRSLSLSFYSLAFHFGFAVAR